MRDTNTVKKKPKCSNLYWGECKIKVGLMLTPTAQKLLRSTSDKLHISQSDILENLTRSLNDPTFLAAFVEQIASP